LSCALRTFTSNPSSTNFTSATAWTACCRPSRARADQTLSAAIVSRLKILSHLNIAEKRLPQDGRIKIRLDANEVDIRVSVIPMLHGEAVVLRLLRQNSTLLGMGEMGMDARELKAFRACSVCRTASFSSPARPVAAKPRRFTPR
jgi:hypothetical protein